MLCGRMYGCGLCCQPGEAFSAQTRSGLDGLCWTGHARHPVDFAPVNLEALNQCDHLVEFHGFDQVRICSQLVGAVHVHLQVGRGEDYDEQPFEVRLGTSPLQHLETIHARHAQIEQHEEWQRKTFAICVNVAAAQIADRLLAITNNL